MRSTYHLPRTACRHLAFIIFHLAFLWVGAGEREYSFFPTPYTLRPTPYLYKKKPQPTEKEKRRRLGKLSIVNLCYYFAQ